MRIQHNIMAMNAYRNYNTNTSALSKNLEKLSSGYKINRAGDDAAGLAISEKMRAQITGLNAAQKNVKDGISLVKTAEGAMQEIQDMLNRMDYLATQSANGTYDNDVDRANLQKEVDQLKEEINRIADSANFNGIKLLDGSLDTNATVGGSEAVEATTSELNIAAGGSVLGVNTIKHTEGSGNGEATTFAVDLADFQFAGVKGEEMTIKVGDNTFKLTATDTATAALTGDKIAASIGTAGGAANNSVTVTLNGTAFTAGTDKVKFNGQDFTVTADGNKLVFTQDAAPTDSTKNVDGKMDVVISGAALSTDGKVTGTAATTMTGATVVYSGVDTDKIAAAAAKANATAGNITFKQTGSVANATDASKFDVTYEMYANGVKIGSATLEAQDNGYVAAKASRAIAFKDAEGNALATVTITAGDGNVTTTTLGADNDTALDYAPAEAGNGAVTGGDWNVQTIEVKNGTAEERGRLASTVVKLGADKIVDGAQLKIGTQTITLSAADADKTTPVTTGDSAKIYIGDLTKDDGSIDMDLFTERLSQATADNTIWTVSAKAGKDGITLMEATTAAGKSAGNAAAKALLGDRDLTTEEGIKATLGYVSVAKEAVEGTAGKALQLQIGDTSDTYNQLQVKIGDMHTKALGIADLSIADPTSASAAIQTIKDAINQVSSVRGDLGATQNRLEHTANNLSVMAENIQDAESTIRDTDVAEEMMAYTKNNILIQSAQAMLAQANAVPQGVLQLLG